MPSDILLTRRSFGLALGAGTGAVTAQDAASTGYAELDQAMGADQPFKGTKVSIQTQWIGGEGDNFAAAVAPLFM